ncbi:prepilin peptidase [Escherichia coli]|uniref:A24 family peptidase n=1 Tax=Escherichia coli TaxID=562 RepID=UPI00193C06C4|nr:prepilin peptidase [Escherichia coli]MBM2901052.1 prepilin peptidase [Escherichia coli]
MHGIWSLSMAAIWLLRVDLLFVALFLVFISWGDILLRIISHRYLLVLTVLIFLALILQHQKPNLVAAGTVLLVGFFLFSAGVIGSGDVKLLTILSLAIDEHELTNFLVAMTFCGALVVLAGLLFFRKSISENGVPYAVPISLAFLLTYPVFPLFC